MTQTEELKYSRILLTHATLNKKIHLVLSSIAGYHHSDKLNCTYVYCTGQNIFPATETCEQIDSLIDEASRSKTLIIP
jgi:enterochelin esterase-like enzyme